MTAYHVELLNTEVAGRSTLNFQARMRYKLGDCGRGRRTPTQDLKSLREGWDLIEQEETRRLRRRTAQESLRHSAMP
jgi:hypothetical protein